MSYSKITEGDFQNKEVLIVEDEEYILQILVDKFTRRGFKVFQAKDEDEGLRIAFKERPDVVLLDIIVTKIGGVTMLKKLRSNGWGRKVLVILLTDLFYITKISNDILEYGVYVFLIRKYRKLDELAEDLIETVELKLNRRDWTK